MSNVLRPQYKSFEMKTSLYHDELGLTDLRRCYDFFLKTNLLIFLVQSVGSGREKRLSS